MTIFDQEWEQALAQIHRDYGEGSEFQARLEKTGCFFDPWALGVPLEEALADRPFTPEQEQALREHYAERDRAERDGRVPYSTSGSA